MHVFCMDLPHSDAPFVKAYPAETTEAFLDGHVSAFAFFGGVPLSILYDNTKLAAARILGDGQRTRTRAFTELISHYLFRGRFGQQATYCIWFSNGADRLSVASTVRSNPSHRAAPTRAGSAVHLH